MKLIVSLSVLFMSIHLLSQNNAVKLSQQFLKATKTNENADSIMREFEDLKFEELIEELKTDNKKLAFWINIYNATTQYTLKLNPEFFQDRTNFYQKKLILIAGLEFSLDEIEHGILRRNTSKYSLGYLRKLLTRKEIKKLMVKKIDPRIHFALNCGAKSCPPILFFDDKNINEQLDLTSQLYLEVECEKKDGKLFVPVLFSWFRGDFGGKKGIYKFLQKYFIIQNGEKPTLIYKEYNWDMTLENYI